MFFQYCPRLLSLELKVISISIGKNYSLFVDIVLFTARIRRRGTPFPGLDGGDTPSQVQTVGGGRGGTPSQVWTGASWRGLPCPVLEGGGYLVQSWVGGTTSSPLGTPPPPHPDLGWGPPPPNPDLGPDLDREVPLPRQETEQHSEHLLCGGRYATCVHAEGLSCYARIICFTFLLKQ